MPKWIDATVSEISPETDRVKKILIKPKSDEPIIAVPGQFITFDLPIGEKRLQRWKSYSIANHTTNGQIELCVGKLEGGLGSTYLCDTIQVGDTLRFKGPDGIFCLPENLPPTVVMICTGTGLAPFRAILQKVLGNDKYKHTQFHLIFGTRYEHDILYREDLEKFRQYPNFKLDIALSRHTGDGLYHKGYVHSVYLNTYNSEHTDALFMLCGWQAMVDEAVDILQNAMMIDKSRVMIELYG
ncbi:MAG: FAD-dependent oxidoreductase [Saprospiraceae bacterium]|nr:FAD-dependent oxidoreductase [Saprospiraceae bacterium]